MSLSAVSSFQSSSLMADTLVPTLPSENAVTAAEAAKARANPDAKQLTMFAEGDDEASFWDFLDVINPLQHIPIVNNLYREATGDKIGVAARLVGGTLFGGPLGLIASAANCILEESTGHDAGGHVIALFRDEDPTSTGTGTALAAAEEKAPAPEAQAARLEASMPQQSQVLAAAAEPKITEPKAADSKADDAAKAQPLLMPDLVGGDAQPTAAAAAIKPVAAAATAVPVQTATEQVASAANRPMPLGRESRLMPIPGRTTPLATQSPPAIGTTVSSTGYRANAPIAGQRPSAQRTTSAAMAQQMVAAQADSSVQGGAVGGQSGDWFSASMMQAMDKYEKSSRLGRPAQNTITEQ
ncbi:conserved exported protein of unknown function [Magnetospirillum sp. XM-1]|uniref:hypothetical protein n=1 Tax=Magnetospirillum sp. XM-1 TaxID=1663591 RepID=UPI00073DF897|nr:hypothetical protein [Magnetospirillum sp. XM-1]CUW37939.1 conserved exported protein of unknown function [Magnetospirillum sp. XM-1]